MSKADSIVEQLVEIKHKYETEIHERNVAAASLEGFFEYWKDAKAIPIEALKPHLNALVQLKNRDYRLSVDYLKPIRIRQKEQV